MKTSLLLYKNGPENDRKVKYPSPYCKFVPLDTKKILLKQKKKNTPEKWKNAGSNFTAVPHNKQV